MSRVQSLSYEIIISGHTMYPIEIDPFSPAGKDKLVDATDGLESYKIKSPQKEYPEIGFIINKKADKTDYNICMNYAKNNIFEDIFIIGRNANDEALETFIFVDCALAVDEKSAMSRTSPEVNTQKFLLLPRRIVEQ